MKVDATITSHTLPQAYNNDTDTTNVADINWRAFFTDSLLIQLIDTALLYNPDLQMAAQRIEAARASFRFQTGELFPKISASLNGGIRKFGLYTMDGAGNIVTEITPGQWVPIHLPDINPGFLAQWEIDLWGKLRNLRKSALANMMSTNEIRSLVISSLVSDIALSYYELQALDAELNIIQQTIVKQQEALDVIQLQKDAARANELAVQQFTAQLLGTKAMEKEVLQQITLVENRINFLIGRFPQPVARTAMVTQISTTHMLNAGIPSQLLENRPDIKAARFQVEASRFNVKAAKAAFFPNINITAGVGYQAFDPKLLFMTPASLAYSAIGSLVAPLINMNALKAQFRKAKAEQISSMYEYQKSILNGFTEVVNELSNIRNLTDNTSFKKQQSDVMQQAVVTSRELYRAGRANYLEVLVAQQNALMVNLELVNVQLRQKKAHVNLYKALGGGWR